MAPFVLQPPEFDDGNDAEEEAELEVEDEALRGPDLFDAPREPVAEPEAPAPEAPDAEAHDAEAHDAEAHDAEASDAEAPDAEAPGAEASESEEREPTGPFAEPVFSFGADDDDDPPPIPERRIIDDAAPFDLDDEPAVDVAPMRPESGLLTVIGLAVVGLVFFGGGAVWATYARPMPEHSWVNPPMVGLLAGLAGALFVAIAVYLLLQRLGRASEREARYRR